MSALPEQPVVHESDIPMYLVREGSGTVERGARDTVGGWPILPVGESWPVCFCGERMVLFFQLDIPVDVVVFGGEHLLVFQCPVHNDAVSVDDGSEVLPERFWDCPPRRYHDEGAFWRIMLHRDDTVPADDVDPYLQPRPLELRSATERITVWSLGDALLDERPVDDVFAARGDGVNEFKVGGVPCWAQARESYICPCGTELVFVCQLPEDTGFDKHLDQPEQNFTFHGDQYGLFLGNMVYIFACPARCHPAAAWPVTQN
ncbi:hypothetical protein [Amycolatopsis sp. NPDC051071]|uniref:hypothetical protein n=1 Tax=Amycolatopsis sp. NPDC051071 TaxID=3154637 RepID=UPI00342A6B57